MGPVTPEQIAQLPDDERELAEALLRDTDTEPLADFIRRGFPHEPPPPHVMPVIELIEEAQRQRIKACLSIPPRHAKTTTILRGIVWWLLNNPADTCAYYSYSDTQARSKSRICRDWARVMGVEMGEAETTAEWRTTMGGGLLAGGLRSGLTGQGVSGLFVVDDPFKNREEADSIIIREKVWDNFNEVVFTRLEGASVIAVHTRWHEDDLIGRLEKDPTWHVINIPGLAEENDVLGREQGEALWPDRFSAAELHTIKRQLGEWSFASLYQGRPRPKGSNIFTPPRYYDPMMLRADGYRIVIGADPAASEKTSADYSVAVVLAVKMTRRELPQAWVLDVVRGQWTVPAFCERLHALQVKHAGSTIAVEAVGGFKAVPQMLKQIDPNLRIVEASVRGDKFTRSQPVAAAWNDDRVYVPRGAPWLADFVSELDRFTGVKDAHDDQVDALAHAWNVATTRKTFRRGASSVPSKWV